MLSEKMQKAYNAQINAETFSAYLYSSMSAYFMDINLNGFANWMTIQAQEELIHAQKFFNFISERRGRIELEAIEKPKFEWKSPLDAFEEAFKHEQYISSRINDLVKLATEENDYASINFLQWYVEEQVEEEASADEIIQKLKLVEGFGAGTFMLDQEMATRTLTLTLATAK